MLFDFQQDKVAKVIRNKSFLVAYLGKEPPYRGMQVKDNLKDHLHT